MLSASLATRSLPRWYRMMGRRRTAKKSADIPWATKHKRSLSQSTAPHPNHATGAYSADP